MSKAGKTRADARSAAAGRGHGKASETPAEAGQAPPRTPSDRTQRRHQRLQTGRPRALLAWLGVALAIAFSVGLGSWPLWWPFVAPSAPVSAGGAGLPDLVGRVRALETLANNRDAGAEAIRDLEAERKTLRSELAGLIERLEDVEGKLDAVRAVAETVVRQGAGDGTGALSDLSQRLAKIEAEGQSMGGLRERIARLEAYPPEPARGADADGAALSRTLTRLSERVTTLEGADPFRAEAAASARATVLAVAQLRETARTGAPFRRELDALKAVAGGRDDLIAEAAILERHAETGVPNLASLRDRFGAVASDALRPGAEDDDADWIDRTLQRVRSLVLLRRVGAAADPGSVDGILYRAEKHLKAGSLATAVDLLSRLDGTQRAAVDAWLRDARARLAVEQSLVALHVHAVSLLVPD